MAGRSTSGPLGKSTSTPSRRSSRTVADAHVGKSASPRQVTIEGDFQRSRSLQQAAALLFEGPSRRNAPRARPCDRSSPTNGLPAPVVKVDFVRHAQSLQLLVQPIGPAIPAGVVGSDGKENVRRRMAGWHVHDGGVLPALLLAVVHRVKSRAPAVEVMVLQHRRDGGDDGKELRMFECERGALPGLPCRSLAAQPPGGSGPISA